MDITGIDGYHIGEPCHAKIGLKISTIVIPKEGVLDNSPISSVREQVPNYPPNPWGGKKIGKVSPVYILRINRGG